MHLVPVSSVDPMCEMCVSVLKSTCTSLFFPTPLTSIRLASTGFASISETLLDLGMRFGPSLCEIFFSTRQSL